MGCWAPSPGGASTREKRSWVLGVVLAAVGAKELAGWLAGWRCAGGAGHAGGRSVCGQPAGGGRAGRALLRGLPAGGARRWAALRLPVSGPGRQAGGCGCGCGCRCCAWAARWLFKQGWPGGIGRCSSRARARHAQRGALAHAAPQVPGRHQAAPRVQPGAVQHAGAVCGAGGAGGREGAAGGGGQRASSALGWARGLWGARSPPKCRQGQPRDCVSRRSRCGELQRRREGPRGRHLMIVVLLCCVYVAGAGAGVPHKLSFHRCRCISCLPGAAGGRDTSQPWHV